MAMWAAGAGLGLGPAVGGGGAVRGDGRGLDALGMLSIVRDVELSVAGRASGRVCSGSTRFLVGPVSFGWAVDHHGYGAGWAAVTAGSPSPRS